MCTDVVFEEQVLMIIWHNLQKILENRIENEEKCIFFTIKVNKRFTTQLFSYRFVQYTLSRRYKQPIGLISYFLIVIIGPNSHPGTSF